MKCQNIQSLLVLYAKNQVSQDECQTIQEHLQGCFCCQEHLKHINSIEKFFVNFSIEPSLKFYTQLAAKLEKEDAISSYFNWQIWLEYWKYRIQNAPLRVAMLAFSCVLVVVLPFLYTKFSAWEKQQIRDNLPIWQMPTKENL